MSYFSYGLSGSEYVHPTNEVNVHRMDIRYRFSPRNRRLTKVDTLYISGEIQAEGAALLARIEEIKDAYSIDYGEAQLYLDGGTPTHVQLINTSPSCVTGVRVLQRSWDKDDGAELAVKRAFSVTLQAEYQDVETQLVYFKEALKIVGTGGAQIEVENTFDGPQAQTIFPTTKQLIIQSGENIGFTAYIDPPAPLFGLPNVIEHEDRRIIEREGAEQQGQVTCFYKTKWTYFFSSLTAQTGVPNTL